MLNDLLELYKKEKEAAKQTASQPKQKDEEDPASFSEVDMEQFQKSKPLIKLHLKALIARDLWNTSEYFQIINDDNEALKKAVEIIGNSKEYNKLLKKK
jgi:carboxyl-terminal processing protease